MLGRRADATADQFVIGQFEIGVARRGMLEIDGKPLVEALGEPFGIDVAAGMKSPHAVELRPQGRQVGIERVALDAADGGLEADENTMADQRSLLGSGYSTGGGRLDSLSTSSTGQSSWMEAAGLPPSSCSTSSPIR